MAYARAVALILLVAAALVVGVPLQWLCLRLPALPANVLPQLFARAVCAILRLRIDRRGNVAEGRPLLLVANHVSWTDIVVLQAQMPCCFLAKREVAAWPVLGLFARLQGAIFVDRTRRSGIPAVNAAMAARMASGSPVLLFAEGTTSDGNRVKKFYSSHFAATSEALVRAPARQAFVQPVGLAYLSRHGLPLGRRGRASVAWYGSMTFVPHLWALLKGGPLGCELVFGDYLSLGSGVERQTFDRKTVAREIERAVRRLVAASLAGRPLQNQAPVAAEGGTNVMASVLLDAKKA